MPLNNVTRLCGAKTKSRGGAPCENPAMENGRCRIHRGKASSGMAHGSYKHGKYSKVLPPGLREKYEETKNDPNLIALSEQIALVDTQLEERLEKVYSGETRDWWSIVRSLFRDLETAVNLPDSDENKEAEMVNALENLGSAIENGAKHFNAFESVKSMVEMRRKLVETESKRIKELDQTIRAEQAMVIITLLAEAVNRVVTNERERRALAQEIMLIAKK